MAYKFKKGDRIIKVNSDGPNNVHQDGHKGEVVDDIYGPAGSGLTGYHVRWDGELGTSGILEYQLALDPTYKADEHQFKIGDTIVLSDPHGVLAKKGAIATVVHNDIDKRPDWIDIMWSRDVNDLSRNQQHGTYTRDMFKLYVSSGFFTVKIDIKIDIGSDVQQNNDGRATCRYCNNPTKQVDTGFIIMNVCTKCDR